MNIFSAAMLKSGSTHIETGLACILDWKIENLIRVDGEGQGEHVINPFRYQTVASRSGQVIGGHHVAYAETCSYIREAGWKPIVLMRNLYDTLVSGKEQLDRLGGHGTVLPPAYVPYEWDVWNDEQKYVWMAYHVAEWQVKFIVSWMDYSGEKLFVRYEDFFKNQYDGFQRILDFYKLGEAHPHRLHAAVTDKSRRFNVGVSGRGAKLIPRKAQKAIDAVVGSWGTTLERHIREVLY